MDHKSAVLHVAFSADESKAVSSTDEGVRVWALPPCRGRRRAEHGGRGSHSSRAGNYHQ